MKKVIFSLFVGLVILSACNEKKEISAKPKDATQEKVQPKKETPEALAYTDTEKELISQICKEDQSCKDDINQKFNSLEFTEGSLEYRRGKRLEYLTEKKDDAEYDDFLHKKGTGSFDGMEINKKKEAELEEFLNKKGTMELKF